VPRIILDTDIGTDVDDALALALLLGSPEVELLGVTTVYGDTLLRARLAQRLISLSGRTLPGPVIPGRTATMSGRPVWWPGHEGQLYPDLAEEQVSDHLDAVEWLVRTVRENPKEIDLVAVGPLTNVAAAAQADPTFAANLRTLTIMGGDFSPVGRLAEHNFRCDAVAAEVALSSGARVLATGLDATTLVQIDPDAVGRIGRIGPLGAALVGEIQVFWDFHGEQWNNPHDPVAVLALLEPGLFTFADEAVRVVRADGDGDGLVLTDEAPTGRVTVASVTDRAAVTAAVVERICAGQV